MTSSKRKLEVSINKRLRSLSLPLPHSGGHNHQKLRPVNALPWYSSLWLGSRGRTFELGATAEI